MELSKVYEHVNKADVSGVAITTPLYKARILSTRYKNQIFIKREDLQPVFSFKCRGAYNKIRQLSNHERSAGIIAASAGNHAQGVAMSAQILNINATIVMPETTPPIKVNAVKSYGVNVVLHGDSYDDAYAHAKELVTEHKYTFIHPYDDIDVIAGQGTLAAEVLEQLSEPIDYVFVAVGGGGLLAGVLAVFKTLSPSTKVIAVEPDNSNCLGAALHADDRVILDTVGIFADGVAVRQIGELPYEIVKDHLDGHITVSTDEICSAIKDIYDELRSIVEPAGALSLAGFKSYLKDHPLTDKNIVTINCGANMNFDRLRHVAERTDIGENKELLFSVELPETPGALFEFCKAIGHRTITEFNYRFQSPDSAKIFVGIENNDELSDLIESLHIKGYKFYDLSTNECAIIHVRHMIGGRPLTESLNERIFRFQFPERPGALSEFLSNLNHQWNITMFHYRNHGAAFGRVLVGFDVPETSKDFFERSLNGSHFKFIEETENIAIKELLQNG